MHLKHAGSYMKNINAYQIPVLQKAILVLHAIAEQSCEPTSAAIAKALGIAPATSYRIVRTFAKARWLNLENNGRVNWHWGCCRSPKVFAAMKCWENAFWMHSGKSLRSPA